MEPGSINALVAEAYDAVWRLGNLLTRAYANASQEQSTILSRLIVDTGDLRARIEQLDATINPKA